MDENMEDLLALYALGALSDADRRRVERHVAANPQAKEELEELLQGASALAYAAPAVAPSLDSRRALMERILAARQRAPEKPQTTWWRPGALTGALLSRGAAAISLVVAMVSLGAVLITRNELGDLRAQNVELLRQLQGHQEVLRIISEPDSISVEVQGTEEEPLAHGRLFTQLDGNTGVFIVAGLPPLQAGSTYQVWLIRDETPSPAGLFQASAEGFGTLSLEAAEALGRYDALAVSVEPAFGSLLPTGPIVLLGTISG